jgi:RimJ/RimL family protein N-acetyltransferase
MAAYSADAAGAAIMIHSGPTDIGDGMVRLREVTRADADRLYEWRMDPETRQMFRDTEVVPYEVHLRFLERYFQADNHDRWFVIEADGGPVGALALYDIHQDGRAEWGRLLIDPARRGRGYARRATRLMLAYARAAGLTEVHCEILDQNLASLRVNRAEGFVDVDERVIDGRRFIVLSHRLATG